MAEIQWGLNDPNAFQKGQTYAAQVAQSAANQQAGGQYAAGDYAGAVGTLGRSGDIEGAMKVQKAQQDQEATQQKSAEAVHNYVAQAIPVFQAVIKAHAGDPDGGKAAIGQAFDHIAPEISQLTGHNDAGLAQIRQMLVDDPQGTLTRLQAGLPEKYQTVGNTIVRMQGDQVTPAYTAPPKPTVPTVHTFTEGNDTVDKQFNPATGQWDVMSSGPRYKPAAIGGGDAEPLNDDALGHQVGMYISSRGNIIPQFGMGAAGGAARTRFYNALGKQMDASGITDADIASGKAEYKANASALTGITKQLSMVGNYEQTVQKNIGIVQDLMGKGAPKGQAPIFNRWIQAGRKSIQGDPDVSAYDTAITSVVNEYAKVMSGGTGSSAASSDSARAEAAQLLNTAQTPAQVNAVLATMKREMANRISSIREQAASLKGSLGNTPGAPAPDQPASAVIDFNSLKK